MSTPFPLSTPFPVNPNAPSSTQFSGRVDVVMTIPPGTVIDPTLPGIPVIIRLDGDTGEISAGGNGRGANIRLRAASNQVRVHLDADGGKLWLGGNGVNGDIVLFRAGATSTNDLSQATIHLDAQAGDIKLRNADVAEAFDLSPSGVAEPGTVMVLTEGGALEPSTREYDRKVAGVVSGARGLKPGITLDAAVSQRSRRAIALVGKVFCKVDADRSPVGIGDLLTTSDTPGYAMKALDPVRAFGAVIGKALRPLDAGQDLIPVLVALQ
jgi:hypothetical protein